MSDINLAIAERQRARDFKEGVDPGFREGDRIRVSADRPLPWWVGMGLTDEEGTLVVRPGLATIEEALRDGGLDFDVALRPLATSEGTPVETHFATVRQDTGAVLGVVGRKYRVIQYRDGLGEFGRAILATDEASVETAGTMFGGRVGCIWFELDHLSHIRVAGEKEEGEVRTYLGLSTSHDGSRALDAIITPVRWVCKNTMTFALAHKRAHFKVRHSGSVEGKVNEARRVLGITVDYMAQFEAIANDLARRRVVDEQVAEIMERIWPVKEDISEGWEARHPARLATANYFSSENLDPIRGTAWGVLQAAVEFIDHEAPYRGRFNELGSIKAASILWGRGARDQQRAYAVVRALK